jgi:hypothetical protein
VTDGRLKVISFGSPVGANLSLGLRSFDSEMNETYVECI